MKGDPEERAVAVGRYLVRSGATVRAAAGVFGVSKSTIWKDQTRLRKLNPGLWREVRQVLLKNKAERHLLQISAPIPPAAAARRKRVNFACARACTPRVRTV